eukprot:11718162-Alexandrium_andersonii.AAC.1
MVQQETAIAVAARVLRATLQRVHCPLSAETVPPAPRAHPSPQVCALAQALCVELDRARWHLNGIHPSPNIKVVRSS